MTWYFAFNILTIDGFIFWRRPEGYRRPETLYSLLSDLRRCCTLFVITNEFCHQRCIFGKIMYFLFFCVTQVHRFVSFQMLHIYWSFCTINVQNITLYISNGSLSLPGSLFFFFSFHNIFKLELAMEETLLTALWPFSSVTRYFFQQFSVHTAM